jgi:hypothetical protein
MSFKGLIIIVAIALMAFSYIRVKNTPISLARPQEEGALDPYGQPLKR